MSFEKAKTTHIAKDFINDRLSEIGKARHRKNHNTNDENYTDIVIRQGWTYIPGDGTPGFEEAVGIGITYDDYPTIFTNCIGMRLVTSGPPANPGDFNFLPPTLIITSAQTAVKNEFTLQAQIRDGSAFSASYYYGFSWIAIGQKA